MGTVAALSEPNIGRRLKTYYGKDCPYCGVTMRGGVADHKLWPSEDHIMPRSRGGPDRAYNRIVVCRGCNGDKRNLTLAEWVAQLRRRDDDRHIRVRALVDALPEQFLPVLHNVGDGVPRTQSP